MRSARAEPSERPHRLPERFVSCFVNGKTWRRGGGNADSVVQDNVVSSVVAIVALVVVIPRHRRTLTSVDTNTRADHGPPRSTRTSEM